MVYKSQRGLCNESYYGYCVRRFAVKCGEHIGISPLPNKRLQARKDSAACYHLLTLIWVCLCGEGWVGIPPRRLHVGFSLITQKWQKL